MSGRFVVITGPTAVGKTTVADALLVRLPTAARLVTTTTRAPRGGEEHGVHYHFTTRDAFEQDIAASDFFEHAEVYGNYYGASRRVLEEMLKHHAYVLVVVDVQGARTYQRTMPEAYTLFIQAAPAVIERRIRGERLDASPDNLAARLAAVRAELDAAHEFNAALFNREGALDQTIAEAVFLITRNARA